MKTSLATGLATIFTLTALALPANASPVEVEEIKDPVASEEVIENLTSKVKAEQSANKLIPTQIVLGDDNKQMFVIGHDSQKYPREVLTLDEFIAELEELELIETEQPQSGEQPKSEDKKSKKETPRVENNNEYHIANLVELEENVFTAPLGPVIDTDKVFPLTKITTNSTTATLVSLDIPFEEIDDLELDVIATPPPPPAPEPAPEPEPTPVVQNTPQAPSVPEAQPQNLPPLGVGSSIVETALQYVGYPYVWGASGPNAFDCSGFTQYIYGQHGIALPRTTWQQNAYGTTIPASEARPGDLVMSNGGGHVMIYLGDGMVVHASTPATGVKVSQIWGGHWFVRVG